MTFRKNNFQWLSSSRPLREDLTSRRKARQLRRRAKKENQKILAAFAALREK